MKEFDFDKLRRAQARLLSHRQNLPEGFYVPEAYVPEYHGALKHLEDLDLDVDEFKIPEDAILILKQSLGFNMDTGQEHYSTRRVVERSFFMIKLDAVLNYLGLLLREEPRKPGFQKEMR
ncbi:MAG TPA: hypothetical protein VNL73_02510 [Verrucomicrobiae bacterium]|nr:hypothetical protein [Verrucomicrobiae bacterium]